MPQRLVFDSPLPLVEEQRKILSAIGHSQSRFIAVEGPPGTGKSHTITAIAFHTILSGKSLLVLSDKKEALDVVEAKLDQAPIFSELSPASSRGCVTTPSSSR
jgi:superfamily II DNA or RNA helicase